MPAPESAAPELGSREAILGRATHLFAQRGFDAVTVREIAAACALSLPTIYHFYASKATLYRSCLAGVLDAAVARLGASLSPPGTALQRIEAFTRALCSMMLDDQHLLAFLQVESLRGSSWLHASALAGLLESLSALIERGSRNVAAHDAAGHAEAIVAFALGYAVVRRAATASPPLTPTPPAQIERLARMVLRAALPEVQSG